MDQFTVSDLGEICTGITKHLVKTCASQKAFKDAAEKRMKRDHQQYTQETENLKMYYNAAVQQNQNLNATVQAYAKQYQDASIALNAAHAQLIEERARWAEERAQLEATMTNNYVTRNANVADYMDNVDLDGLDGLGDIEIDIDA